MPKSPVKTKRASFDQNSAVTHQAIAPVGGKTIKIKMLLLCALGVQTVTINSAGVVLATLPLPANGIVNLPMIEGSDRYFESAPGQAFNIGLSTGTRLTGFMVYEQS